MNDLDQAARFAAKLDPAGFFRWLTPGLDATLSFAGWLDTRTLPFPGDPERTCDSVAHLTDAAKSETAWALVVEFQAEPDPDMLGRLLEYVSRLYRELGSGSDRRSRYKVAAALLNLTGPAQPDTLDMRLPDLSGPGLWLQVVQRTMREEDAAHTLEAVAHGRWSRCQLPWIPLMHGAAEIAIINHWKELANAEPDMRRRSDYAGLALVFASLAGCFSEWKRALEGWNMRTSEVIDGWRAEGRAEGLVQARRADVLRLLQLRFKVPIPADLAAEIGALNDPDELTRWLDSAAIAGSLEAFRTTMKR
jgi:hypothetical protein